MTGGLWGGRHDHEHHAQTIPAIDDRRHRGRGCNDTPPQTPDRIAIVDPGSI
jgi:hypothetical protein